MKTIIINIGTDGVQLGSSEDIMKHELIGALTVCLDHIKSTVKFTDGKPIPPKSISITEGARPPKPIL